MWAGLVGPLRSMVWNNLVWCRAAMIWSNLVLDGEVLGDK